MSAPAMVKVQGLEKRFGDLCAVDCIDFEVHQAECFGLLGANGAGKSTTIKMMIGLLTIDSGTIEIAGDSVGDEPAKVRAAIGYVPQMLSVDGALTGYENLLVFAKLYGLKRQERRTRIQEILEMLGLVDAADRPVKTYSGGMIRRLEIGQAILHHPLVLLLDEPTVGLDPLARKGVWEHIERLREEYRITILLTTHYMDEAESLCTRIAIMSRGRIAAMGSAAELRREIGQPRATMDDVFAHFAGQFDQPEGAMRDVARSRRTARRLG